jgi:hypothetical protein
MSLAEIRNRSADIVLIEDPIVRALCANSFFPGLAAEVAGGSSI